MKKLFTLLTMLVIGISGMWADGITPGTFKIVEATTEKFLTSGSQFGPQNWNSYVGIADDDSKNWKIEVSGTNFIIRDNNVSDKFLGEGNNSDKGIAFNDITSQQVYRFDDAGDNAYYIYNVTKAKWMCIKNYNNNTQLGFSSNESDRAKFRVLQPWTVNVSTTSSITVEYTGIDYFRNNSASNGGKFLFDVGVNPDDSKFTCTTDGNVALGVSVDAEAKSICLKLPFTPTTITDGNFSNDTKYYLMTLRTRYIGGWNESKFPGSNSLPDKVQMSDMWAFVGNNTDGFNIFNREQGATYAVGLATTPTSGTGNWGRVAAASAQKFVLQQNKGRSGNTVQTADCDNNKNLAVFNFREKTAGTYINYISDGLGYWKDDTAPGEVGCDLVFYEVEEYDIFVAGHTDGRVVVNGCEYKNGDKFYYPKNTKFRPTAKSISNYQAHEISISGNTISVEYYEVDEYEIEITGDGGNGRIIINDVEYADGQMFYNPKDAEFTPSAKIISYYHAGDISIGENTISLDYTEITVPDGYNGFIAGKTNIDENDWKTKSNWLLVNEEGWTIGPGYTDSNMWEPIYLQGVTAKGIEFEGWGLQLKLVNSSLTASTTKIQAGDSAPVTIDVDENSELKLTLSTTNNNPKLHTFNIDGKLTIEMAQGWDINSDSDNRINLGTTGNFTFTSKSKTIPGRASFTISATLADPTEDNKVQSRILAKFNNTTVTTLSTNISADGWTKATSLENLKAQTSDGKYYYVEENSSTGVILYTYKLNAPVEVNSGAITVAAEITSGVVSLINTAIVNNNATSVDLTGTTTTEITGLVVPDNCLVIVNDGTTVKNSSNVNIENNVVVKDGEDYSCENLVLTDKVPFKAPVEFTATNITHERTTSSTSAVWGTACLPYPVQSVSGEGDGIRYYQLSESNSKEGVMSFTLITDVAANTPVVFIKSSDAEFNFNATGKNVAVTPENLESSENQGMTLVGTFAGSNDVATDDSKNYYYISGNKFWRATGTLIVSPFRAYFTETKGGQSVRNYTLQVVDDGNVTRIDSVEGFDMSDEQVYTLDGKRVNNVKKGSIYVIGGNKVVIK